MGEVGPADIVDREQCGVADADEREAAAFPIPQQLFPRDTQGTGDEFGIQHDFALGRGFDLP
jgi:hypothetical protein